MKHISRKWILKQLKADLIGKDSHRGVTLTYSWMANQFGHFSLGFIPTLLVFQFIICSKNFENPELISGLLVSLFWLIFELYNFLGPLIKKRKSKSIISSRKSNAYIFTPKWWNIGFDTFTDLCFFWLGAFSSSLLLNYSIGNFVIILILIVILIYPCMYWYQTKMYQIYAHFPFQFRLSQWDYEIGFSDQEKVHNFMTNKTEANHLLIFGSKGSGKTSLSIGIVNELSIKHKTCLYITSIKLFSLFFTDNDNLVNPNNIWNWHNADFLIIDDINPGEPIKEELVDPDKFLSYIDTLNVINNENRNTINQKNIIWVLGDKNGIKSTCENWTSMLIKIGVEASNINSIEL